MNDSRRKSKLIDIAETWKYLIISLVLLLICGSIFLGTMLDIRNPTERYDTYIDVREDGFETVNFFFTNRIEKSMGKPVIMREAGMELLTDSYNPDGLYYKYSVVYRNGTILETPKEFIPFGVNRTLLDFDDIELSILQIFTKYGPSSEEINEEFPLVVFTGLFTFVFVMTTIVAWADVSESSGYRRRYR
jgi:hypothetical protein